MLAKLKNQDQLAFIISHELAHYTLDHVNKRIQNLVIENYEDQVKKASIKLASQYKVEESLTSLKNILYSIGANSKTNEQEADSLGLIYMHKAGFNASEAIKTIQILKYSNEPDYPLGDELFDLLIFEDYPFDPDWLRPKLRVYEKKPTSFFIFSLDSINSHPTYDLRISKLQNQIVAMQKVETSPTLINAIRIKSAFASIEAARFQRKLDESLHRALQMFNQNIESTFARDMIAKNLFLVYKSKTDGTFTKMAAPFTGYYSEELRFINTYLYNINNKELAEVIYRFLKVNRLNDKESELYYALLSSSCNLSLRKREKKEVVKEYKLHYPKGKHLNLYLI